MREIIRVERKRVLNIKIFFIMLSLIFIYSIFSCVSNYMDYTVYDSSGNITITANDNLLEYKKNGEIVLNNEKIQEVINRRDKGGYTSYLNLARIILANYSDKKLVDITKEDISEFYNRRLINMEHIFQQMQIFSHSQVDYLLVKAAQLNAPIEAGYAEGWRNLNNDMVDFMPIILAILSIVLLSVFGKNPKVDLEPLCLSTKYGKTTLIKAKILAGLEIGVGLYFISVILFTLPKLIVFGADGLSLPIQNDVVYFYSAYNITYIQQYLLNISMGLIAVFFMVSVVLFLTSATEQILSGAVLVVFFWVLMLALPSNLLSGYGLPHYVTNFLPYNMTNFNSHYNLCELYSVLGTPILSVYWLMVVGFLVSIVFIVFALLINSIKLRKPFFAKGT